MSYWELFTGDKPLRLWITPFKEMMDATNRCLCGDLSAVALLKYISRSLSSLSLSATTKSLALSFRGSDKQNSLFRVQTVTPYTRLLSVCWVLASAGLGFRKRRLWGGESLHVLYRFMFYVSKLKQGLITAQAHLRLCFISTQKTKLYPKERLCNYLCLI